MLQKIVYPFIYVTFYLNCCFAQLQTTWVKTLFYQITPSTGQVQDSLWLGPEKISMASDRTYFVLNKNCPGYNQSIYHFDSLGNIISNIGVGHATSSTRTIASNLYTTPDSGCIYLETYSFITPDYTLYKISKNGVRSTIKSWINSNGGQLETVDAVVPNYHNGYYCSINSNFYDIPSNTFIPGFVHCVFNNDDFLVSDSMLKRKDVTGNVIWAISPGFVIAHSELSIYLGGDSLVKVDAITGAKLWTKALPPGNIFDIMRSTDGLISLNNRSLFILDSTGTITDSNVINLTYSRASTIASGNDGSIYTGGEFVNYTNNQMSRNYSSLLIKLNDEGKGVVDSTNLYLAGDADNDSYIRFIKDGLFVAAAIGQTTNLSQLNENIIPGYTTYSELWQHESACGINYRYSDGVMDGIINIDDVNFLDFYITHYAFSMNDSSGSLVRILFDNNIVLPGDTIRASVILGTAIEPTDSIYGFSIEPLISGGFDLGSSFIVDYKDGVLGDTSINLNVISSDRSFSNSYLGLIFCRNDHQNVSIAGDTIFRISAVLPPIIPTGFYTFPSPCFAIKQNGCFTPLNVIADTLNVGVTSVDNLNQNHSIEIFPNPSNEEVNIVSENNFFEKIKITDISGQTVFEKYVNDLKYTVSTRELKNGIYIIETCSGKINRFQKLIILHK